MKRIITCILVLIFFSISTISFGQTQTEKEDFEKVTVVYPSLMRSNQVVNIKSEKPLNIKTIELFRSDGYRLDGWTVNLDNQTQLSFFLLKTSSGAHYLKINLKDGKSFSEKIIIAR